MTSVLRQPARATLCTAVLAVAAILMGLLVASPSSAATVAAAKATTAKTNAVTPKVTAKDATSTPATVSADALPTVQANGVIWSQVTVGNTVYATGSFTETYPAGQAATASNETARSNLLAYNITTGALVTSFNHSLNAQGLDIVASPDNKTVYVVGDFTTVDGVTRNHIAAFDVATGNLTSFAPSISGSTHAVAVSSSAVYVGGNFFSAGGATRTRLAAFTTGGALLSWAPTADVEVDAMVISPDSSRVIVGGRFTTLTGVAASGLGAIDPTTGATYPFTINNYVQDGGTSTKCGITALTVDANQVYGSGFAFGCGNFEGRFAADPDTGNVVWINDCHGDTYSVAAVGQVLYSVGHAHDCSAIGGFPDTNPRTWHRAIAETTYATGTDTGPDSYGWNYNGQPDATQLDWYPTVSAGTYTGQSQGAWSVTGNTNYIALGGEFPSVNGVAQSDLVRFAVTSLAPNKVGPQVVGSNWKIAATSLSSGTVRVSFPSNWDPDNASLTYTVYRDSSTSTPVYTTTTNSTFWQRPTLGFTDTGLSPGSTHQYKVFATDQYGNTTNSSWLSVTVAGAGTGATSTYSKDVLSDGASDYWRFGETSGTTAYDYAGFDDMTENNGVTQGAPGSVAGDPGTASSFNGSNQFAATSDLIAGPNTFSVEGWFKTTSTTGGLIAGFGDNNTALSGNYDRHIYMDGAGHVTFGVYNNGVYSVSTTNTLNDGQWHYVVGTLSNSGVALYVDGKLIGTNSGTTSGQPYSGYWHVGGDNVSGWPNSGANYFNGSIDDVAVYPSALSLAKIRTHFLDAGGSIAGFVPAPTDNYGKAVYGDNPSVYYRADETTGTTASDSSGNGNTGTYYGNETLGAPSPVSGSTGSAVTFSGTDGSLLSSNQSQAGPSTYSEELWFKTSTTSGGKLIGFGDSQSGTSSNYDRHIYMTNGGQLVFGVYSGGTQTITSNQAYNDGAWHYVVATQGSSGMNLYVDGQLVGTNPTTTAQGFN
ncbi:LamG-like jellyroll fold domain-containing protein, partial [Jatrophihabitans endophyticus]|uniref:LamG-like jellyroll fold domain-containing protein n=1 Tax=Jatrophihabitans endophyticus TaxID=1206085 RepID=UPI0019F48E41